MAYRLLRILLLGWSRDKVPSRGSKLLGVVKRFLKGLLALPFIPWVKRTFARNAVDLHRRRAVPSRPSSAVVFFATPHMLVWKSLLGFGWPTLPFPVTDWLAAVGIAALVMLLSTG